MDAKYIRVLEHGTDDQIRIGYAFLSPGLHKAAVGAAIEYDQKLRWCGGDSAVAARKYYRRICLVDAITLQTVAEVFDGQEWVAV